MQVIAIKAYNFQRTTIVPVTVTDAAGNKTEQLTQVVHANHRVQPSSFPQTVPDWIVEDDLYKYALADGGVVVVGSPALAVAS